MHKLLARLIRRNLNKDFDTSKIEKFLDALDVAFYQHDQDRSMLERSLMLTSKELNEINNELRHQLIELESSQRQLGETLVEQRSIIDSTPEAILSFEPGGKLKQVNKAGCQLFKLPEEKIRSNTRDENIRAFLDRLAEPVQFLKILRKVEKDNLMTVRDYIETKDGEQFECYSVPTVLDDQYIGRVWAFRDVTEAKKHQEILQHQAFHDSLTGLPNRSLLLESIDHAIALAKRNNNQVTVLFIDLDDFKKINDTAGHHEGDRFLVHISREIQAIIRESDIVGRLGGDEFVVVLEGINQQNEIINIHDRIISLFSKPFQADDNQYFVTCSIGVSSYPQDGNKAEVLIRKADMAMYQAKRSGKNTFRYFDDNLARIAMNRVAIESQLRVAIAENQFVFHFQPKINMTTRTTVGFEALIRWQKPNGDLVFPDNFIPVAEETGLVRDITRIVIKTACQKLQEWRSTALANIPISINISASDFTDVNFLQNLFCAMDAHNTPEKLLELELTESLFLDDTKRVKSNIAKLKERSLLLSIDDFGTGYSSFSHLHDLDIDYLKIDKSFVQSLFKNEKSKAIVKSIIDLGENLGIEIVAEGIETEDDHNFLKADGCHIGQGYHYSRPLSEDQLIPFIEKGNH